MRAVVILGVLSSILAVVTNIYIYTYPSTHPQQCSWQCYSSTQDASEAVSAWEKGVQFAKRYLSDIKQRFLTTPSELDRSDIHIMAFGDPQIKGIWRKTPYMSRLDVFGNDYYLGHIAKMMYSRLSPSHVVVMGDLFSSQWIGDSEFYNRTMRYMTRIFQRDTKYVENIKQQWHDNEGQYSVDWNLWADDFKQKSSSNETDPFGYHFEDVYKWDNEKDKFLFINLTGNHDVGYSGDATYQHMARFHQLFGKDNFWIEYDKQTDHPWRIVVLNSMLLEGPALQPEFVEHTWEFLHRLSQRQFNGSTVLLTHVPFYKPDGLCSDGQEFTYYPEGYEREPYKAHLLKSQNHISKSATNRALNLIFDNNKPGVILTGHDHVGCETMYTRTSTDGVHTWQAAPLKETDTYHIKEITVRSMMGEFQGATGLLTGHFDTTTSEWKWSFKICPFSVQHIWWTAQVSLFLSVFFWSLFLLR